MEISSHEVKTQRSDSNRREVCVKPVKWKTAQYILGSERSPVCLENGQWRAGRRGRGRAVQKPDHVGP